MQLDEIRSDVLSQILLIQNVLPSLPGAESMLSFTCRGLDNLPGVESVTYLMADDPGQSDVPAGSNSVSFPVHLGATTFATVYCGVADRKLFDPYHAYVNNLCFMIAARLEEQRHHRIEEEYLQQLEAEVESRTRELRETQERAEKYLEISEAIVVELDETAKIERINLRGAQLLGYRIEEIKGRDWFELVTPPDERAEARQYYQQVLLGLMDRTKRGDHAIVTRTGETRFVHWHTVLRRDEQERVVGTLGSGQDVTERLVAEREKELLLREVYHRTKNNMQVISSLLALQAEAAKEQAVRDSIGEAQNRIASMALVHNMLYSSGNVTQLCLQNYVRQLAENLLAGYAGSSAAITLEMRGGSIPVSLEMAIHSGLVLNEMITNSVKHAFCPSATDARIVIEFERSEDTILIVYGDNGRGLPEGFDPHLVEGLGMRIIETIIVEQLKGTVETGNGKGVTVRIRIPVPPGER